VLQCVAVCCTTSDSFESMTCDCCESQCVAVCCCALQCVAVCCSVLHTKWLIWINDMWLLWIAVCCSVLQCVAVCCSVLQCVAVSITHRRGWFFNELSHSWTSHVAESKKNRNSESCHILGRNGVYNAAASARAAIEWVKSLMKESCGRVKQNINTDKI